MGQESRQKQRPGPKPGSKKARYRRPIDYPDRRTISLSRKAADKVDKLADRLGVPWTTVVRELIDNYLDTMIATKRKQEQRARQHANVE